MGQVDSWAAALARDFNVELLCRSDNAALFWALREGASGTFEGTNTVGLWQFGEAVEQEDGVSLSQWHVHRFTMADRLRVLQSVSAAHCPVVAELAPGLQLVLHAPGKFSIVTGSLFSSAPVPQPVGKQLRQDLKVLARARAEVSGDAEDDYSLAGATTAAGSPVRSISSDLIAAMAFEWLTTGGLYAGQFGIYSAHCTCCDFRTSKSMSDDLIAGLISGDLAEDAGETMDVVREFFAETERRLFSTPIWSEYGNSDLREVSRVLSKAMAKLTRTQRVQFILLNGMHRSRVMMPLAAVSGVISFEEYASARCWGLQPDSTEEQDVRKETAIIKLYGELAGENPVPSGFEVTGWTGMWAEVKVTPLGSGMSRHINPSARARRVSKAPPARRRPAPRATQETRPRKPAKRPSPVKRTPSKKGGKKR